MRIGESILVIFLYCGFLLPCQALTTLTSLRIGRFTAVTTTLHGRRPTLLGKKCTDPHCDTSQHPSNHLWWSPCTIRRSVLIRSSCIPRAAPKSLPDDEINGFSQNLASDASVSLSSRLSHEEIARYSRHLVLSQFGMQGQLNLKNSAVLVIGAGGLGSPFLMYLAAAGVGHIGIVDADTVDVSNLQRQIIHGTNTLGMSKCQSAAQRIQDLNPHVQIRLYEEEFTSASAERIVRLGFSPDKPYDIVIDGSDNFPTKYLINDICSIVGLPWVYSAILAFEGQLSVFNMDGHEDEQEKGQVEVLSDAILATKLDPQRRGPDYRDLLPTPPPPGDVPSCAEGGVLGVLPGTMGCLQATEAIKYLMGRRKGLLSGRVLVFDAMQMKFSTVGLKRSTDREIISSLIDYQGFCGGSQKPPAATTAAAATTPTTATQSSKDGVALGGDRTMDEADTATTAVASVAPLAYQSIAPTDCLKRLSQGWSPWVLDVRLPTENAIVTLPFVDRVVPHRTVRVTDIPKEGDVLVYCKAGTRSKKACASLIEQGVDASRLYNLDGGILQWQKDVDPSMPRY